MWSTVSTYANFSERGTEESCRSRAENVNASRIVAEGSCRSICSQRPVERSKSGGRGRPLISIEPVTVPALTRWERTERTNYIIDELFNELTLQGNRDFFLSYELSFRHR